MNELERKISKQDSICRDAKYAGICLDIAGHFFSDLKIRNQISGWAIREGDGMPLHRSMNGYLETARA